MSAHNPALDSSDRQETVACALTAPGRSAVAVIGVRGSAAAKVIAACFTPAHPRPLVPGEIRFGQWDGRPTEIRSAETPETNVVAADSVASIAAESVVVSPLENNTFEVHCHGGLAAVDRIFSDLRSRSVRRVDPHEWLRRFTARPELIAEAEEVLTHCRTARTAAVALDQTRGASRVWADGLLRRLADSDDETTCRTVRQECGRVLSFAGLGLHLTEPFRVVLFGPPNVGKSSLINALVGYERSITFDRAGTTRDVLHAETVFDGLPVRLSDTAGLRVSEEAIERQGVARARLAAADADLILWVHEPGMVEEPPPLPITMLRVLNKIDRLADPRLDRVDSHGQIGVSALTGEGLEALMRRVVGSLVKSFPEPGEAVPMTPRQATCLREALEATTASQLTRQLERFTFGGA